MQCSTRFFHHLLGTDVFILINLTVKVIFPSLNCHRKYQNYIDLQPKGHSNLVLIFINKVIKKCIHETVKWKPLWTTSLTPQF